MTAAAPALSRARTPRAAREVAGAFGDVGVFLPLALGLIAVNGLSPTLVFGLAGAYYIATGWVYRLPVPVQPFKAVSALAIAHGLSAGTIHAAALGMSAGLLLLSVGGVPRLLERVFAAPVVRGIQLGLGLILLQTGVTLAERDARLDAAAWLPPVVLVAGVVLVALIQRQSRVPALFVVVIAAVAWGALTLPDVMPPLAIGPVLTAPAVPTSAEFVQALWLLVLPQLPLTLGNSIVSTTDVARDYFGERAARVRPRWLLRDMGIANLAAGLAGGIPMCHGAGGMTAHVRFGARTGASMVVVGVAYLVLGVGLGAAAPAFLALFPSAALAVLVGYVGWQHLLLVRRLERPSDLAVALLTGLATITSGSLALAFLVGLAVYWAPRLARSIAARTGAARTARRA